MRTIEAKPVRYIHRHEVKSHLQRLTDCRPDGKPLFPIFAVYVHRREDLFLRYPPINMYDNGPLVRVGDYCLLTDKGQNVVRNAKITERAIRGLNAPLIFKDEKVYSLDVADAKAPVYRRKGDKIILEAKGKGRWMLIKNWAKDQPQKATKHWQPKGEELRFNPADHDLFMVQGMYNDKVRRYGQWRPWAMICLRSITTIRILGVEYRVIEPPIIADN